MSSVITPSAIKTYQKALIVTICPSTITLRNVGSEGGGPREERPVAEWGPAPCNLALLWFSRSGSVFRNMKLEGISTFETSSTN